MMKLRTSHVTNSSSSCFILRDCRPENKPAGNKDLKLTLTLDISQYIQYTLTKKEDLTHAVYDFLEKEPDDPLFSEIRETLKTGQTIYILEIEAKNFPYELVTETSMKGLPPGVTVIAGGRWWG